MNKSRQGAHHLDRRAHQIASVPDGAPDQLLDSKAVADWLGVSRHWVVMGRLRGYGPPFLRISSARIRYRRGDVLAWLSEREHRSTAEYL